MHGDINTFMVMLLFVFSTILFLGTSIYALFKLDDARQLIKELQAENSRKGFKSKSQ